MSSNRFAKSVSFNTQNDDDKRILNHIKRRNFSGYVKKLILQDIQSKELAKGMKEPQLIDEAPKKLTLDDLMEELKKAGEPASSGNKVD
jgi:hypothetical protein